MDFIYNYDWFTIIIYLITFFTLNMALNRESKDIFGWENHKSIHNSTSFIKGKYDPNDDIDDLLKKIVITGIYEENSVKWRRSIIFSILLTYILLILLLQRAPTGYEITISFFVIYIFIYLFLNLYQYLISEPAGKQLNYLVEKLKEKIDEYNSYQHYNYEY